MNFDPRQQLTLPAPAKLNLFLHVCGRRADGYHQLQTVFQFLDHGDELCFQSRRDGQLLIEPELRGIPPADNLIYRAADALRKASGCQLGANIVLTKNLPMGGGIGGGSSDAATTLVALNTLWNTGFSKSALQTIGLKLGADVPVFIYGRAAWAEGIGEHLQAIELPEPWYLVVIPPCHVSTAEIFSHEELTRDTQAIRIAAFLEQGGRNDCETLVKKLYPEVEDALDWLNQFGPARMTGTGACVFTRFASRTEALAVLGQLPESLKGFIARGANQSPLYKALEDQMASLR